ECDSQLYITLIRKTYQKDYEFIEDYYQKINELTTKLKYTISLSENDFNLRISEYFYQGLDKVTKFEAAKLNLTSTYSIKEHIIIIEKTILNLARDESIDTYT
ncbi:hypothetical protein DMUE_6232, partial [Dictyocoela muelleri]